MKRITLASLLAVSAVTLTALKSVACMAFPLPGSCSLQMVDKISDSLQERKSRIKEIRTRIRHDSDLRVNDVALLAGADAKTNIDLIQDEKLRTAASAATPIAYARRLEALRPKLAKEEWAQGILLWEKYIARSEDLWEPKGYQQFCDLQKEGKAFAVDAGYIFAWPFVLKDLQNGDIGATAATAVIAGPASMAVGVVGLGADVATFIPNVAAKGAEKLRSNFHVKLSARAFHNFAEFVEKQEKGHI